MANGIKNLYPGGCNLESGRNYGQRNQAPVPWGVQFRKWQELWTMESRTCTLGGCNLSSSRNYGQWNQAPVPWGSAIYQINFNFLYLFITKCKIQTLTIEMVICAITFKVGFAMHFAKIG